MTREGAGAHETNALVLGTLNEKAKHWKGSLRSFDAGIMKSHLGIVYIAGIRTEKGRACGVSRRETSHLICADEPRSLSPDTIRRTGERAAASPGGSLSFFLFCHSPMFYITDLQVCRGRHRRSPSAASACLYGVLSCATPGTCISKMGRRDRLRKWS